MKTEKFVYNKHTLQYEKVTVPVKVRLFKFFGYLSAVVIAAIAMFLISSKYLPSPKEQSLQREISQLDYHLENLTDEYTKISDELDFLQQKDADIHRQVFGMEPIDKAVWEGGVGGHDKYAYLNNFANSGDLLKTALTRADKIKRQIALQKTSLDSIYNLAKVRELKLAAIPSIKPVQEDKLKRKIRYLSGFGWRMHPIHKVKKFHNGIDFTAPEGTPIQATGDGKVKKVEKRRSGYGYSVTINHGYGYETLYAHMKTILVKKGEKVKKGQKIGTVGNTGSSTAPHLHYEVRLDGRAVNPIDYCMDGLSPMEYQELLHQASVENQSFH